MARMRRKIPRGKSKRMFTRTAKKVHRRNGQGRPMRGGIRM